MFVAISQNKNFNIFVGQEKFARAIKEVPITKQRKEDVKAEVSTN